MFYTYNSVSKIVYGAGVVAETGKLAQQFGASRVIIVTDPSLAALGLHKPVETALSAVGLESCLFSEAELEPSAESIEKIAAMAKDFGANLVVGLGGGSALDSAKAACVLMTNEGPIDKYFGVNQVPNPCAPALYIPTTAGTGSEVTSISVLADKKSGAKLGVVSDYMYAKVVILDPEMTTGLPARVTAMTGVDAFVHAMESFVGKAATPFTDALNLQAMKLIARSLRRAYVNGQDVAARADMLYASTLAGMGFSNTQNGIIHAIGTAVPRVYNLPHGLLMACLAPMGMRYNVMANPEKYAEIARILGAEECGNTLTMARRAPELMAELLVDLDIKEGLAAYGVTREDLEGIAQRAAGAVRLMGNNPRPGTAGQLQALLEVNH